MSWVTVAWSTIASACLTLAVIYFLVWWRNRTAWAHLLFSLAAASTTVFAFCELSIMRAETIGDLVSALTWAQVSLLFWLVSLTWFVYVYLGAGRRWLAWTITGMCVSYILINFLVEPVSFREVASPRHIQFLGESISVLGGKPNPLMVFGQSAMVLILIFVADASVTAWRRGDRRKALMVGGSVEFFLLAGLVTSSLVLWANIEVPIVYSVLYLGLIAVMGYELSRDVLRASQLVQELQASEAGLRESEARMSLAVDAADFGIWTRSLTSNEIWASEKWRELFGFTASQRLEFSAIVSRLHPDDREGLREAQALAVAGANDGRYQAEFRLVLPDGTTRWISSQGRVERDAGDQPLLMRGASSDITARKRAELAVRNLSGRLLSAQEDERRRIARELHDNLSQQMAILGIGIGRLSKGLGEAPEPVARAMRELNQRVVEISTEIHDLSHRLHSSKLEMLGLVAALRGHCQELLARGVHVRFQDEDVPASLPPDVALCLFRVAQEALNNVVKHSGAREAEVSLRGMGEVLVLSVADSGRGFDPAVASVQGGLGLASMRERLRLIEGEFPIRSQPGQGTTIVARVPVRKVGAETAAER
jgi:PAS domain S-box-containing protein